jgi:2-oxoglutarate dehydrogenase complex dehydrogenase (E1) component-like enzyme
MATARRHRRRSCCGRRFLRSAAEGNIRVASPTTPAQYFHLLRRQARIAKQRPLVVMTPKSLLRLPQAASAIADMAEGTSFQPVLAEPGVQDEQVTRLVLCTGKIYYDLGYVGRPERASPGEGYPAAHIDEQNRIVTTAIDLRQPISQYPRKTPGER